MRPRRRDPSFLVMAAVAGLGGVLAIVLSIGFPIWMRAHTHAEISPAFSLFSCWGIFALFGSYACVKTYLLTDEPPKPPPRGGVRLKVISTTDVSAAARPNVEHVPSERAA